MWDWEQPFWRETIKMDVRQGANGWSCCRTWTLAVLLFIFTCRLLRLRFRFRFGGPSSSVPAVPPPEAPPKAVAGPVIGTAPVISDLYLKQLIDDLDGGSSDEVWENVIDKGSNLVSYKAKCCKPKDGPLKYLSVTLFEDCSAESLLRFYMDNQYRVQWDKTVVSHQQLQLDQVSGIEFGRTVKKFPLLSPREYVLAWKLWQGLDGSFYCMSKECEHPLAPRGRRCVRVEVFRSGWRIRKVPGRNASEIMIVHQEDAGLNVEMAKMFFAKGIWSYVCKMDDAFRKYSVGTQPLYSSVGDCLSIQKVPPGFEVPNNEICTHYPENSIGTNTQELGTQKSSTRKLGRRPSSKFIINSLVFLGGAVCLSKGHSSFGAKVAMAYMLSKITKRNTLTVRKAST